MAPPETTMTKKKHDMHLVRACAHATHEAMRALHAEDVADGMGFEDPPWDKLGVQRKVELLRTVETILDGFEVPASKLAKDVVAAMAAAWQRNYG